MGRTRSNGKLREIKDGERFYKIHIQKIGKGFEPTKPIYSSLQKAKDAKQKYLQKGIRAIVQFA